MSKWLREFVFLWKWWGYRIRHDWKRLLPGLGVVIVLLLLILPFDSQLLQASRVADPEHWTHGAARKISYWGDYYTGSVILSVGIWLVGVIRRNRRWRMIGMSILMAGAVAGISVNLVRLTAGRPRPSAQLEDGFYGLKASSKYHGFPSGHAATSIGTASAVAFSCPPVAIPAYLVGFSVCWSRIELNRHHWTDILAGSAIGVGSGYLIAYRRRRRRS